jgi:hypothetical protein
LADPTFVGAPERSARYKQMAGNIIELSIDPETAFYIIVKAREFDEKTAP